MKTFFFGPCDSDNFFKLSDPDASLEVEFEADVIKALTCLLPNYHCRIFSGSFVLEGLMHRPDMVLVAKDFSHWFIVEVELASHSLELHVLPQIRTFCFGDPQQDCISVLSRELGVSRDQAITLLNHVPRRVAVVANKRNPQWQTALDALGAELVTVSVFKSKRGVEGFYLDGVFQVQKESLGFGVYSAADRSVRISGTGHLPSDTVQIVDLDGTVGSWNVVVDSKFTWITKVFGSPAFRDGEYLQLIRSMDGQLRFRDPNSHRR